MSETSVSLEFLRKDIQDLNQDEWIQYLQLVEENGGTAGIKAAQAGTAANPPAVDESQLTGLSRPMDLVFKTFGPQWEVHTTNKPPPEGGGLVSGTGLQNGSTKGTLTTTSIPHVLTSIVYFTSSNGKLNAMFFDCSGATTGCWEGSWSGGPVKANGIWHFSPDPPTK